MTYDVSSEFVDEAAKKFVSPLRKFYIGGSDYSDRVTKWPIFKRYAQDFKVGNLKMTLSNHDGGMNQFYMANYKFVTSCYVQFGFDYGGSTELITTFTGTFNRVAYSKEQAVIHLKDKLFDMQNLKVGSTDSPVDISSILPSELFWILTTCYGQLDDTRSTNNPDIDFDSFSTWAEVFSDNAVGVGAHYEGEKVAESLSRLAKMTDSTIYAEGDGKIYTQRYSTVNSEASVIGEAHTIDVELDVVQKNLINKQHVGFDYSVESEYWTKTVISEDTASQNSYGVYEDYLQDETVWYVDSVSANNVAARLIQRYKEPPKIWKVKSTLRGLHRQMGETIKFANDFYNQTSESGTRLVGIRFDTHNGTLTFTLDTSVQFNAFTLDVDSLDHPDRYLL